MKIAFCASEAVPFAKTGGLADVCGALPVSLEELDHEVVVILPRYKSVHLGGVAIKPVNSDFDLAMVGKNVRVYFVKHSAFLRDGFYGDEHGDYPDNLRRFSYFCAQCLELLRTVAFRPEVIHCHDWQTSLIPAFLRSFGSSYFPGDSVRSLLTIHNLAYQGIFPKVQMPETGLGWDYFQISGLEFYNQINLLKGGIVFSDMINTVSPTYRNEVLTPDLGCGLDGVLAQRVSHFSGIPNGIDYRTWNPQSDPMIATRYSVKTVEDRVKNKLKLQEFCAMARSPKTFLLGFVGRLVEQKGVELLLRLLPKIAGEGIQMVILGTGEPKYMDVLRVFAKKHPAVLFFKSDFDDLLAHQIYASVDAFLMPSRFEPCGIGQMISYKYGAVPIVHKTGGLADTVKDYQFDSGQGTGFVFDTFSDQAFYVAIKRAVEVFAQASVWQELVKRVMTLNFSWKESARQYSELYHRMVEVREQAGRR